MLPETLAAAVVALRIVSSFLPRIERRLARTFVNPVDSRAASIRKIDRSISMSDLTIYILRASMSFSSPYSLILIFFFHTSLSA